MEEYIFAWKNSKNSSEGFKLNGTSMGQVQVPLQPWCQHGRQQGAVDGLR